MCENCEEKKDYGKTLNLPKTDFPMRGNLPENEPKTEQEVFENDLSEDNILIHSREYNQYLFNKNKVSNELKGLPFIPEEYSPRIKIIESNLTPSQEELLENNRARSAKLRVIEKVRE